MPLEKEEATETQIVAVLLPHVQGIVVIADAVHTETADADLAVVVAEDVEEINIYYVLC